MRIDPNTRTQQAQDSASASASADAATTATRGATNASTGGGLGNDTAQISGDQARVQSLAAQVNALPEIRQEKVSALGRAVRNGSYQVSPEQTAESLISEMLARSFAA